MQTLNNLLPDPTEKRLSPSQPTTTTPGQISEYERDFTDHERDVTAYFFLRLKNVYGSKYYEQYPTGTDVNTAKREYAARIGQLDRQKIHALFEALKAAREAGNRDLDWPDIDKILGLDSQKWETQAHKLFDRSHALEDKSAYKRSRVAGSKALDQMKALFGE